MKAAVYAKGAKKPSVAVVSHNRSRKFTFGERFAVCKVSGGPPVSGPLIDYLVRIPANPHVCAIETFPATPGFFSSFFFQLPRGARGPKLEGSKLLSKCIAEEAPKLIFWNAAAPSIMAGG